MTAQFVRIAVRVGDVVTMLLGIGTAVFLLAMMVITTIDVAGRYLFSSPLPGAFELTQVLLAATIFAGLPVVTLKEEHVAVTLLTGRLSGRAARLHQVLVGLIGAAVMAVLADQLAAQAARLGRYGDTTSLLRIPLSPLAWTMAGLTALAAMLFLALALAYLGGYRAVPGGNEAS